MYMAVAIRSFQFYIL